MEIWPGVTIASLFLLAWWGGSHTGMRQCRSLSDSYQKLTNSNMDLQAEIGKMRLENDGLKLLVGQLRGEVDIYRKQVDSLSAMIAMMRRESEERANKMPNC